MSLEAYLITNREATYILKVNGESMIEAGILQGDMLLVECGAEPRDGDIVIASVAPILSFLIASCNNFLPFHLPGMYNTLAGRATFPAVRRT